MRRWPPIVSWLGHRLREVGVHMDRVWQRRDLPRIAFFVEGDNDGLSAGLRAYQMAEELRKFSWRTVGLSKQTEFSQRHRLIHLEQPEIVILQKSRHPLNRPKYFPDSICLFDIDDADFAEPNFREGAIE